MFKNFLLLGLVLLLFFSSSPGQTMGSAIQFGGSNSTDQDLFITIVPIDSKGSMKIEYEAGEHIYIKVLMVNTSTKNMNLPKGDRWYRPRLVTQGQVFPYSDEMALKIKEQEYRAQAAKEFLLLEPRKPNAEIIDISEWYGTLKPGLYDLSFQRDVLGEKVDSNKITFMITQ
jgi:hypothetical protein